MEKIGTAKLTSELNCMLISDMARKAPWDTSAINAMAGVRQGHDFFLNKDIGAVFVKTMPANKQLTKRGISSPISFSLTIGFLPCGKKQA